MFYYSRNGSRRRRGRGVQRPVGRARPRRDRADGRRGDQADLHPPLPVP
ncbi:hypothetical protein [Nocardioides convexus]|nr:hypothetical protein [Nocardioides convexus]